MVALQIREVPDVVRDTLAETARDRGQSLQAFLLGLVTDAADAEHNRRLMAAVARRKDIGSTARVEDVIEAIEVGRNSQLSAFSSPSVAA